MYGRVMGLDILCYGGRAMRLLIQGCLILWLGFFSSSVFAAPFSNAMSISDTAPLALSACEGHIVSMGWGSGYSCFQFPGNPSYPEEGGRYRICKSANYGCYSGADYWRAPVTPEECLEKGEVYNSTTGSCTLDCPFGQMNGQCLENPNANCSAESSDYMGAIGSGGAPLCESQFNECQGAGGQFGLFHGDSVCIADNYGPPTLCGAGEISVYDSYGFTCAPIMGGEQNPQWQDGVPNQDTDGDGVPDIYNPNIANTSVAIHNAATNIFNQNNRMITQNNTTNQNLNNINNTINQGNEQSQQGLEGLAGQLGQISGDLGALRGMGERGELSGGGVGGDGGDAGTGAGLQSPTGEDYLADLSVIETNTKNTADRLQTLEDGMKSPEGGFNPNGFGGFIPTFEESGTAFISAIEGMSQVQALTKFANIQENTVCPVFTLPATPVSGELVMDIHCRVFEDYRAMISAIFLFFWSGLSLFVFFKA